MSHVLEDESPDEVLSAEYRADLPWPAYTNQDPCILQAPKFTLNPKLHPKAFLKFYLKP